MPKYFYICTNCYDKFSFHHGMNERKYDCLTCDTLNTLKKVPSSFSYNIEKENDKKIGEVVQNTIKELHDELEQQKNELKDKYYKTNE